MKQLLTTIIISLSFVITGITAFASNTSSILHSKELISTFATADDEDEKLGPVNLCDPNGAVCLNANAYKDHETGRIYLKLIGSSQKELLDEHYAQKSNDSRWEYMIRYDDQWYYFSF